MASEVDSVIITITLSLAGVVWSVISYTLFTKWFCCSGEALKDKLLNYLTDKCSRKRDSNVDTNELQVLSGEEGQDFEAEYNEARCTNSTEENQHSSEHQHIITENDHEISEENHHSRELDHTVENDHEISVIGKEMNTSQLLNSEPRDAEDQGEGGEAEVQDGEPEMDLKEEEKPLIGGHALNIFFTVVQIIAKPIVIAVNVVYLVEIITKGQVQPTPDADILGNENSDPDYLRMVARFFSTATTYFCILYECLFLVTGPITAIFLWTCCWRRHGNFRASCCRKYLEFLRFNDLEVAVLLAPFANIDFFFLGGKWYSVLIVRLLFYAITFAAAVIAGMRFVCGTSCFYCCACACNTEVIEIRTYKQLFAGMGFQLLSIFLKLMTASSAFATYLQLGIQGDYSFRLTYLTFTVIRGVSSMFSLGFTAALLRWMVLKREFREKKSCLSRLLRWVDNYQPHTHIVFIIDMVCYIGLVALNVRLLNMIRSMQ